MLFFWFALISFSTLSAFPHDNFVEDHHEHVCSDHSSSSEFSSSSTETSSPTTESTSTSTAELTSTSTSESMTSSSTSEPTSTSTSELTSTSTSELSSISSSEFPFLCLENDETCNELKELSSDKTLINFTKNNLKKIVVPENAFQTLSKINPKDIYGSQEHNNIIECNCGLANKNGSYSARIQNGAAVSPKHKYPWMVLVRTSKRKRTFLCGGAIISKHYILTSAHCFLEDEKVVSPTKVKVTVGDHSRSSKDDIPGVTKVMEVEKVIVHPSFSLYKKEHDIALLRLRKPIDLESHKEVGSICLPEGYSLYKGGVVFAGWGIQDPITKTPAVELYEADGVLEDPCYNEYPTTEAKFSQFCLKGNSQKAFICQGDSGGPIMRKVNGRYEVIGIISNGISFSGEISQCSLPDGQLNVMKVCYYLDWIRSHVDLRC